MLSFKKKKKAELFCVKIMALHLQMFKGFVLEMF